MRSLLLALREGKGKVRSQARELLGPRERTTGPESAIFESQAATSRVCVDIRAGLRQPYSKG